MAQEILQNARTFIHSQKLLSFPPPSTPHSLPGVMDTLSNTIREWLSMTVDNGTRLIRLLNILSFILENIADSFSGRHWAFMCSVIHAAFSGHFEPVSNFFVDHHSTSIFLFSSSLSNSGLDQLIDDLSFMNCLIRELISFHQFKGLQTPELLCSVLFSAADFLSVLLLVKFIRNVPPVLPAPSNTENPEFSPVLSLITELDQTSAPSEEGQNDLDAHLELQHDLDLQEQNAQDVAAFNDWITGSGYNGLFWDESERSIVTFYFRLPFLIVDGRERLTI